MKDDTFATLRWILPLLSLAACAEGSAEEDASSADSGPVARADAGSTSGDAGDKQLSDCPDELPMALGSLGQIDATTNYTDSVGNHRVGMNLSEDPLLWLYLKAIPGAGVFSDGVAPGSYPLEKADADFQFCNNCATLWFQTPDELLMIMAESGVLDITIADDELHGTLRDATFRTVELVFDNQSKTCTGPGDPVCGNTTCSDGLCARQVERGNCETSIANLMF